MAQYMLILHDVPVDYATLGRVELSQLVQKYVDWMEDLKRSGRYVASFKLGAKGGRRVTVNGGQPVPRAAARRFERAVKDARSQPERRLMSRYFQGANAA